MPEPPSKWGADPVTKYIDAAQANAYATFANLPDEYGICSKIDDIFRDLLNELRDPKKPISALFLLRSHSSYLAAVSLGTSGRLPEAYAVLRLCLENALYGYYFFEKEDSLDLWLTREESEEKRKEVRNEFKMGNLLTLLRTKDRGLCSSIEALYGRVIDYGAHPNVGALAQHLEKFADDKNIRYEVKYIVGDGPALRLCLKTIPQVGVCVLRVFSKIFEDRFASLGMNSRLDVLASDL